MRGALVLLLLASCGRIGFGRADDAGSASGDGGPTGDALVEPNYVFYTSMPIAPTMLGSRTTADAFCQARAAAGALPGTYVAWISTTSEPARTRLGNARGWVRLDGLPVADDLGTLLTTGRIWYPIRLDEHGIEGTGFAAATGTTADGNTGNNCNDWTNPAGNVTLAEVGGGTEAWTAVFGQIMACNQNYPLLCFGVDRVAQVAPPAQTGRIAFLSSAPWIPGAGRADADARCAMDASAAGLTGSFKALLPTTTSSALSRFNTTDRPMWVRRDGVPIASSFSALAARTLVAPIDVTANGQYIADTLVWAGASDITATPVAADNCTDWTMTTGNAWVGSAGRTSSVFFGTGTAPCSFTITRLYCFEE